MPMVRIELATLRFNGWNVRYMASDRGQNRYSDFQALETLLRFENCSLSHCLLASWRRFHVFESSHPSFHRTVFLRAPLAFLRGVAIGLCRRCVIFMSSCRRVFLSSTALHTCSRLQGRRALHAYRCSYVLSCEHVL